MYCQNCAGENPDGALFCSACGHALKGNGSGRAYGSPTVPNRVKMDDAGCLPQVVSFCMPIVGIVLYFVWKGDKPNSAKQVCVASLAGWVLAVLLYVVLGVLSVMLQ